MASCVILFPPVGSRALQRGLSQGPQDGVTLRSGSSVSSRGSLLGGQEVRVRDGKARPCRHADGGGAPSRGRGASRGWKRQRGSPGAPGRPALPALV